jgi:hypothetical protein
MAPDFLESAPASSHIDVGNYGPIYPIPQYEGIDLESPGPSSRVAQRLEITFDGHYPVPKGNQEAFIFFGSASAIALTTEVVLHACPSSKVSDQALTLTGDSTRDEYIHNLTISTAINDVNPSYEIIESLAKTYISSIDVLFPLLNLTSTEEDLQIVKASIKTLGGDSESLDKPQTHSLFRILMICCISSASQLRQRPWLLAYQYKLYNWALKYASEVTSEVSDRSFQALMLLAIFYLFQPQKGDIWMLLDSVSRLSVLLGYHTEGGSKPGTNGHKEWRRNMFWTFYKIEHMIGQLYGRPSDSLESIMIVEYPNNACNASDATRVSVQKSIASHLYSLAFLRSKIFRDIYLPATSSGHNFQYYQDQYSKIYFWYREAVPQESPVGIGTVSCDIAFHSSIIFLYQKSLMTALSATKSSATTSRLRDLESDNYISARNLILIYDQILNADESSNLRNYPLLFTSIYDIYTAGLTVLAHCLIAIDGRTKILASYNLQTPSNAILPPIDYREVYDISASCISLLAQTAVLWPAMQGMLSIYKEVSGTVLPNLMRSVLA